jgi:hypothetical protein
VALLSLVQNTARITEPPAALVQARRMVRTSDYPVKIEEPIDVSWQMSYPRSTLST